MEPLIRNISDTARWTAAIRARESELPNALFHDPLAARLAAERGHNILDQVPHASEHIWAMVVRTWLFDRVIASQVQRGADMVINLAAGLDARPYRMTLPPELPWVEIDLPDLLAYKEIVLADETPRCRLERIALDLSDVAARRAVFENLGRRASKALVLSEGLLVYLSAEEVGALARDLHVAAGCGQWAVDLVAPMVLRMLQATKGVSLEQAGAPMKFAPPEGPAFFEAHGWRPAEQLPMVDAAIETGRLPKEVLTMAPPPGMAPQPGETIFSGVCLFSAVRA
jgi:methyltransferase (TIGR00027 family)